MADRRAAEGESDPILSGKQPTSWTPRRVEMPHIQGLRFLAMTWIIAFHYIQHSPGTALETFVNHRPLDLFTVISGFATHLAYGRKANLAGPGRMCESAGASTAAAAAAASTTGL